MTSGQLRAVLAGALVLTALFALAFRDSPMPTAGLLAGIVVHLALVAGIRRELGSYKPGTVPVMLPTLLVAALFGAWAPASAISKPDFRLVSVTPPADAYARVAIAATFFAVAAVLACSAPRREGAAPSRPTQALVDWYWRVACGLTLAGIGALFLYAVLEGVPPSAFFITSSRGLTTERAGGGPQFILAGIDLAIAGTVLAYATQVLAPTPRRRRQFLVMASATMWLYFSLGFRYRVVVLGLALIFCRLALNHFGRRRTNARQGRRLVALGLLAIATFTVTSVVRGRHELGLPVDASAFSVDAVVGVYVRSLDIATPYAALVARRDESEEGLLWGRSYKELPAVAVPRVLLPSKPKPVMIAEVQSVTNDGVGAAVPLWAEADLNFDLAGVVVLGVGVGRIGVWARRRRDPIAAAAIVSLTAPLLASVLSRSVMFWAIWQFAFVVGPVVVAARIGPRRQSGSRPPPSLGSRAWG